MNFIPPYKPSNIHWEITFEALGWSRDTIQKLWEVFYRINTSHSGEITILEFLNYFNLDRTRYVEKCFEYFDTTGGNDIDFLEFTVSVWNICTLDTKTLPNFTFDLYDLDSDGELTCPEIEKLVHELYGNHDKSMNTQGKECLKNLMQVAEERGGVLSLSAFANFTMNHSMLLFPVHQIQRSIQIKVLGIRFWKAELQRRSSSGKKKFNPRYVQILLRTYKTGSAASILTHTGDPNEGLKTWYQNENNNIEEIRNENSIENPTSTDTVFNAKNGSSLWNRANKLIFDKNLVIRFRGMFRKEHKRPKLNSLKSVTPIGNANDDIAEISSPTKLNIDLHRSKELSNLLHKKQKSSGQQFAGDVMRRNGMHNVYAKKDSHNRALDLSRFRNEDAHLTSVGGLSGVQNIAIASNRNPAHATTETHAKTQFPDVATKKVEPSVVVFSKPNMMTSPAAVKMKGPPVDSHVLAASSKMKEELVRPAVSTKMKGPPSSDVSTVASKKKKMKGPPIPPLARAVLRNQNVARVVAGSTGNKSEKQKKDRRPESDDAHDATPSPAPPRRNKKKRQKKSNQKSRPKSSGSERSHQTSRPRTPGSIVYPEQQQQQQQSPQEANVRRDSIFLPPIKISPKTSLSRTQRRP